MKSVVVCGSTGKFGADIIVFCEKLKKLGVKVYMPLVDWGADEWDGLSKKIQSSVSRGLTYDHFEKIKKADVVFIYNKSGYAGYSTTMEIGYAAALSKTLIALEEDEESFRNILYEGFAKKPEYLLKFLK